MGKAYTPDPGPEDTPVDDEQLDVMERQDAELLEAIAAEDEPETTADVDQDQPLVDAAPEADTAYPPYEPEVQELPEEPKPTQPRLDSELVPPVIPGSTRRETTEEIAERKGARGFDDDGNVRPADGRWNLEHPEV